MVEKVKNVLRPIYKVFRPIYVPLMESDEEKFNRKWNDLYPTNCEPVEKMKWLAQMLHADFDRKASNEQKECIEIGDFSCGIPQIFRYGSKPESHLKIGKFCAIATPCTVLLGGNHRKEWGTIFPISLLLKDYPYEQPIITSHGDVTIGDDVWIGRNVTILSGVRIGNGACIAANATVTSDVAPYSIVGGCLQNV